MTTDVNLHMPIRYILSVQSYQYMYSPRRAPSSVKQTQESLIWDFVDVCLAVGVCHLEVGDGGGIVHTGSESSLERRGGASGRASAARATWTDGSRLRRRAASGAAGGRRVGLPG